MKKILFTLALLIAGSTFAAKPTKMVDENGNSTTIAAYVAANSATAATDAELASETAARIAADALKLDTSSTNILFSAVLDAVSISNYIDAAAATNISLAVDGGSGGYAGDWRFPRKNNNAAPFRDLDAQRFVNTAGTTDYQAVAHINAIIKGLKLLGLWDYLDDLYLLGTNYNNNASVYGLRSLGALSGSATRAAWSATFNGTSDGYTFSNPNQSAGAAGLSMFSVYNYDLAQSPSAVLSSYMGGSLKGPYLLAGGSPVYGSGPSTMDNFFPFMSQDGAETSTHLARFTDVSNGEWNFTGSSFSSNRYTYFICNGYELKLIESASTNIWNNNANYAIGKNPNNTYYFGGEIAAVAYFTKGLSAAEGYAVQQLLEGTIGDNLDFGNQAIFLGNSLTASSPGGGATWPSKFMDLHAWTNVHKWINTAEDGAKQITSVEPRHSYETRSFSPLNSGRKSYAFLWSGVNDITAGYSSAEIIESIDRHLRGLKDDNFTTVVLTITPVASVGDGTAYQYTAGQQNILTEINTWMRGDGTPLIDYLIDLDAVPELQDPLNATYYISGDGLHQTDAGRQKVAEKVFEIIPAP